MTLVADPLCADDREPLRLLFNRFVEALDWFKAELPSKANGAEHAQRIVVERLPGFEGRAQPAVPQVVLAFLERIEDLAGEKVLEQRVDREVAALCVFLDRRGLGVRLARVVGVGLLPRRRELDVHAVNVRHRGAEPRVGDRRRGRKFLLPEDLGGLGGVAEHDDVEVVAVLAPEQLVADRPTDEPRTALELGAAQGLG